MSAHKAEPLPREIAPGVVWFGKCSAIPDSGVTFHLYNSAFLVAGDVASLLVETGPPATLADTEAQIEGALEGRAPLRYIFPTHPETNHAGGLTRLLAHFPEAVMIGDPTDLHHYSPRHVDRISDRPPEEPIDLGGRAFSWTPALFRDHPSSRWGFDDGARVLFTGDGLAYSHYHLSGQCGRTVEEAVDLDVEAMVARFSGAAFPWTHFTNMEPYIAAMDELFERLEVDVIAPTHGLPITDLAATLPKIRTGLRRERMPGYGEGRNLDVA